MKRRAQYRVGRRTVELTVRETAGEVVEANTPRVVAELAWPLLPHDDREGMLLVMVDTRHKLIGTYLVSIGSRAASIVHPAVVFRPALLLGAAGVILVHNHPSGDTSPSREDKLVTDRIKEAGGLLGIELLDHVIVSSKNKHDWYSFQSEGWL